MAAATAAAIGRLPGRVYDNGQEAGSGKLNTYFACIAVARLDG